MKRLSLAPFLAIALLFALSSTGQAETLRWNAVTTYTDNTTITAPVTYTARWSTSPLLSSPHTLASGTSSLSVPFNVDTEGMTRGSTVYFGVYAIVQGQSGADGTLAWVAAYKVPGTPGGLGVN